jgi:hypothetical protein
LLCNFCSCNTFLWDSSVPLILHLSKLYVCCSS